MILTDEILEKAARAIFEEKQGLLTWDACISKENFRRYARACISAILPDIVGECAKVSEKVVTALKPMSEADDPVRAAVARGGIDLAGDIAIAIRQLK